MRSCYLDASALVKLATPEPETDALRAYCSRYDARLTSRLALVEVARALLRLGMEDSVLADAVDDAFRGLEIAEVDASIADTAGSVGPPSLRTLDAIHLASALTIGDELEAVITYDGRLADAARAAGLTVVAPA